jgi:hypothetical protein
MKYQPHIEFSAQGISFRALQHLYGRLKDGELEEYEYLTIVVFAAFSIEAYINSIGSRKIVFWDQIERLPWEKKIEILHGNVGATPAWGADPLQLAKQFFTIRDKLAHGRAERVSGPICDTYREAKSILMVQYLKPNWFSMITEEWLLNTNDRLCKLLAYLGALYSLPDDDFTHHSQGTISDHIQ